MIGSLPTARVLIVEDHALLAESLRCALRAEDVKVMVAPLVDQATLIAAVQADPPDVILLDLQLGDRVGDGTQLVRPFTLAGARVLVVSGVTDRCRLAAAVEQGAVGIVGKSQPFDELLEAVLAVTRGEQVLTPDERRQLVTDLRCSREQEQAVRARFDRLTHREQQVLHALGEGMSVGNIAQEWVVSEATVRSQVRGVLMKLGVTSQLEAVAHAARSGWLRPARETVGRSA